jgi:F-type H+-transporting ATPase subunit delta
MNESLITVRYAKALYEFATEQKKEKNVLKDVEMLLETCTQSAEFVAFLGNPLIRENKKADVIDALFKEKTDPLTLKFMHLLLDNKREIYLAGICRHFIKLNKQTMGIQSATITTAQPLTETHKKEIYEYISGRFKMKTDMSEKVDPGIIGGFILRVEDQQINASLQAQLKKIKRELINS